MKFGKQFLSQMIPEWQEAYLNYDQLKSLLKEVSQARQVETTSENQRSKFKRRGSLYRAFSGLTGGRIGSQKLQEDHATTTIHTNIIQKDCEECYQSMLLVSSLEKSAENEVDFFKKLDDELNEVVGFYRREVGVLTEEAEELSKQMDILIALRIKVEKPPVSCFQDSNDHVSLTSNSTPTSTIPRTSLGNLSYLFHMPICLYAYLVYIYIVGTMLT